MQAKDQDYIKMLIQDALANSSTDIPVAAMLVKDTQILARSLNERERKQSILAHAELLVLEKAAKQLGDWNLSGTTLYVTLEPCPMCAGAILQSHVSRVVFGAYEAKSGAFGSRYQLANANLEVVGGVCELECAELLRQFFSQLRENLS